MTRPEHQPDTDLLEANQEQVSLYRVALRTSAIYWIFSALWILFSDRVVARLVPDAETMTRIQMFKGWGFVTVTAVLLYILLRAQFRLRSHEAAGRIRADRARRESEARMRVALNASKMGVWEYDFMRNAITWDDQMMRLYQVRPGDFTNDYEVWEKAVHPDDRARACKELQAAIDVGIPFDTEFRIVWPNGEIRHIRAFARVIRENAGPAERMFGINFDVTEQRKLEEQLRQSQKMEAIGQLAGGVAHDFNNLLTVIYGYTQNILGSIPADHPLRPDIEQILLAGERAADLTRQLLAVSRKTVVDARVIDLNNVVRQSESMLRRLIPENIELNVRTDSLAGAVRADAGLIGQVLLNLVVNARDAIEAGGRIRIATQQVQLGPEYARKYSDLIPGEYVRLSVSDNGSGMSPDVQAHIFEPFFTTKEVGKGTGLGLATVFGIVKQCGGIIDVESNPGAGATFDCYFPAVAGPGESEEPSESPIAKTPAGIAKTILVVEDEEAVRAIAVQTLERHGYQVFSAASGREAVAAAERLTSKLDMLITDVVMPGMSGLQLAESMRNKYPDIKILFMSGYTSDTALRDGIREGEVHFIQKPFKLSDFASRVEGVISAGRNLGKSGEAPHSNHPRFDRHDSD